MAKTDWNAIYDSYLLALESEPELSAASYARRNDLNINSARRSFNKIKSERSGEGLSSDRSVKKSDRSASKSTRSTGNSKAAKESKKPLKSNPNAASQRGKTRSKKQSFAEENEIGREFDRFSPPSRRNIAGEKYRDIAYSGVTHGAYMDIAKVDEDIREAAGLMNQVGGVRQLASARYLQMQRVLNEMIETLHQDYEDGKAWKDENGNNIPKSKAIGQTYFGTSSPMTELEGKLLNAEKDEIKQAFAEHKFRVECSAMHPLTREQQIGKTNAILSLQEEEELTAVQTSYLFERQGLAIPRTLAAEADKEISMRQPVKEDAPEATAEELDAMMEEYSEELDRWDGDWLEERMKGIEELKQIDSVDDIEVIE